MRVSQIVETKTGVLLTFVLKEQKEIYYVKAYQRISIYSPCQLINIASDTSWEDTCGKKIAELHTVKSVF